MKQKFLYLLIIIGICFRLALFGRIPVSLNRDEAALGYNAFAIATAGIDEWGVSYPLLFKSFGDFKLPGYIYSLVPLVKIFDPSEWVVRLPSLLAGIGLIYLTYLVVVKIGSTREIALFSAAIVAVSPWTIFYSRVAFEANLALTFFIAAGYLLSSAKSKHVWWGIGFYILAIATYNTPLLLTPIIWLIIAVKATPLKSKVWEAGFIALIALSWFGLTAGLTAQKGQITIFANPHIAFLQQSTYVSANSWSQKILAGRYVFYPVLVGKNTLHWFSPDFLVKSGGQNPWHSLPGKGHLYYVVYVLCIFQIISLLRQRKFKVLALTFALLVISILPSIITVDSPHATRSLLGLWLLLLIAGQTWQVKTARLFIGTALIAEIGIFGFNYFGYFPTAHAPEWRVGLREEIVKANVSYPTGTIAIINPYDQPYIYTLLYTRCSPRLYSDTVERYGQDAAGLEKVKSYGRWLFIGDPKDVPSGIPIIYPDTNHSYKIIDINSKL
ncbi:hypothetical protein A3B57_01065 [Microgenomates group bacterium RIFCSPLOWO2_01_FULL_47_10]|nr:MAG: hypothetical protein A3B57_01065 [Microgenomates group bacterium RIFCSPLOWO2_01_FULL_47_10]